MKKHKTVIDKYFVINCIGEGRNPDIVNESIINTFGKKNVYIYETCVLPKHYKVAIGRGEPGLFDAPIGQLGCSLSHYMAVKLAYKKGYNNIIVFEDDCVLRESKEVKKIIKQIPEDADIVKLSYGPDIENPSEIEKFGKLKDLDKLYIQANDIEIRTWGSWAYYLSRKAMKAFIDFYDDYMNAADIIFVDFNYMREKELKYYLIHPNARIIDDSYLFSTPSLINDLVN